MDNFILVSSGDPKKTDIDSRLIGSYRNRAYMHKRMFADETRLGKTYAFRDVTYDPYTLFVNSYGILRGFNCWYYYQY